MQDNNEQGFTIKAVIDPALEASEAVAEQVYLSHLSEGQRIAELEAKVAEAEAEVARLEGHLTMVRNQRDSFIESYNDVQRFIQASIDREEWTPEELAEQYWKELAEMLDLNLKLERTITVTATWNLTIRGTQKHIGDCDFDFTIESDGDFDIIDGESYPDVDVNEN